MTTKTENHAAHLYATRSEHIHERLATIKLLLRQHETAASKSPRDWSFVGDLGAVSAKLDEIASFLLGNG